MHRAVLRSRGGRYVVAALILAVLGIAAWAAVSTWDLRLGRRGPVTITDDLGREVAIPRAPRRIVSIAPSNTEILFALGLGDRVAGVTDSCDYPEEAKAKPKVGAVDVDYEKILEIAPDLVVAVGSLQRQAIDRLTELGVPVLAVNPKSLDGVLSAISMIGTAAGVEARARALTAQLRERIEAVESRVSGERTSRRPRVFVEIWNDPLMTAGPGTFIDELIAAAGGENVAHDAMAEWPQIDAEAVIQKDPEVIVLTNFNLEEALARPAWQTIAAYRSGRVFEVDPDLLVRPGPRLVQGLEELARLLHPEAFE